MADFDVVGQFKLLPPANLQNIASQIKQQLNNVGASVDIKLDASLGSRVKGLSTSFDALNSSLNNTITTGRTLNQVLNSLSSSLSKVQTVSNQASKASISIDSIANSSKKAKSELDSFETQIQKTSSRFAAFVLVSQVFNKITNAIGDAVTDTIKYQGEIVKLTQVSSDSASAVKGISDEVIRLSTSLGVSSQDLIKQASTLRQAGLTAEETRKALTGLAKAKLAPSFDNLDNVTEGLIALKGQFGITAAEFEKTLGSINAVSNKFAVESSDLVTAVRTAGASFKQSGGDLAEFLGVFTSIRQTTREAPETIATGLKTIFAKVQNADVINQLKEFNIQLRDTQGNFIGGAKAIQAISAGLSGLSPQSQRYEDIAESIGGSRNIGKIIVALRETKLAQDAANEARRGGNSLDINTIQSQDKLEVKLQKVKEQFLEIFKILSESQGLKTFADIIVGVTSAVTGLVKILEPAIPLLAGLAAVQISRATFGVGSTVLGSIAGIRRSTGGPVPGQGSGDKVPAMLEPNEFVLSKRGTSAIKKKFGNSFLSDLNQGNLGHVLKFASGGEVPSDNDLARIGVRRTVSGKYQGKRFGGRNSGTFIGLSEVEARLSQLNKAKFQPIGNSIPSSDFGYFITPNDDLDASIAAKRYHEYSGRHSSGTVDPDRIRIQEESNPSNVPYPYSNRKTTPRSYYGDSAEKVSGRFESRIAAENQRNRNVDIDNLVSAPKKDHYRSPEFLQQQYSSLAPQSNSGFQKLAPIPSDNSAETYGVKESSLKENSSLDLGRSDEDFDSLKKLTPLRRKARFQRIRGADDGAIPLNDPTDKSRTQGVIDRVGIGRFNGSSRQDSIDSEIPSGVKNVQDTFTGKTSSSLDKRNRAIDDVTQILLQESGVLKKGIKSTEDYQKYQEAYNKALADAKKFVADNGRVRLNASGRISELVQPGAAPKTSRSIYSHPDDGGINGPRVSGGVSSRRRSKLQDAIVLGDDGEDVSSGSRLSKLFGLQKGASLRDKLPGIVGGAGLLASFAAPYVSKQVFGTAEKPGFLGESGARTAQVGSTAIAGVGQGVATGLAVGGPIGALLGGVIGLTAALLGAKKAADDFDKALAARNKNEAVNVLSGQVKQSLTGSLGDIDQGALDKVGLTTKQKQFKIIQDRANTQYNDQIGGTFGAIIAGHGTREAFKRQAVLNQRNDPQNFAALQEEGAEGRTLADQAIKGQISSGKLHAGNVDDFLDSKKGKALTDLLVQGSDKPVLNDANRKEQRDYVLSLTKEKETVEVVNKVNLQFAKMAAQLDNFSLSVRQAGEKLSEGFHDVTFANSANTGNGGSLNLRLGVGTLGATGQNLNALAGKGGTLEQAQASLPDIIAKSIDQHTALPTGPELHEVVTRNAKAAGLSDDVVEQIRNAFKGDKDNSLGKDFKEGRVEKVVDEVLRAFDPLKKNFAQLSEDVKQAGSQFVAGLETISQNLNQIGAIRDQQGATRVQASRFAANNAAGAISVRSSNRFIQPGQAQTLSQIDRFNQQGLQVNAGVQGIDLLSTGDLNKSFQSQQERLTGLRGEDANSPEAIEAQLKRNQSGLATAQKQVENNQKTNPQAALQGAAAAENFKTQIQNNIQALKNLQDASQTTAAAQEKLARVEEQLEGDRRSRLSFGENFINQSPQERLQTARNASFAQNAIAQGDFSGFSNKQAQGALAFLNQAGQAQLQVGTDSKGQARFASADNIKEQLLINSGFGAQDQRNPLFDQRRQLNGEIGKGFQTADKASDVLIQNLTSANDVLIKNLDSLFAKYFQKAGGGNINPGVAPENPPGAPTAPGDPGSIPVPRRPKLRDRRHGSNPGTGPLLSIGPEAVKNPLYQPKGAEETSTVPKGFSDSAKSLATALAANPIPSTIDLKFSGTVNVNLNGAQLLPLINTEMIKTIDTQIAKAFADRAGGTVGV